MSDPESTLKIYLSHRSALVEYVRPLVGCPSHAEDVVQEAWLRFVVAARDNAIAHPVAYLYRTVRNGALDMRRRLITERARAAPAELGESLPTSEPSPEDHALERARLRAVEAALAELPERTRKAFDLHRFGGLTLNEVAQRLGISVTLAHRLVHAAMMHCASRLGPWNDAP